MKVYKIVFYFCSLVKFINVSFNRPSTIHVHEMVWGRGMVQNDSSDYCNLLKYIRFLEVFFNQLFYFKIKSQHTLI